MSSGYEEQRRRRRVSAPIASAMIDRPAPMLGVSDAAVPPQPAVPPRMPEIQPPRPAPYAMDPYEMNRGTMAGPVPNAPVDVTAGLGISRPRYANTPAIEDVADPTLTSPGATP